MRNQNIDNVDIQKNSDVLKEDNNKLGLLEILNNNDQILYKLKNQLKSQLDSYEYAFSPKVTKKYTEDRDFDTFKDNADLFKQKSIKFIDSLVQVRNNCTEVIKNLPQREALLPSDTISGFDSFTNQQIDKLVEFKVKKVRI